MMGEKAVETGSRDLYAVLGVASTATQDEIKTAFRRLAAKYHPDRNANDRRAATRFKRVNAAYQVLSDPSKKREYDRLTQPIEDDDGPPSVRMPREEETPKNKPSESEAPKSRPRKSNSAPKDDSSAGAAASSHAYVPPERELLRDNRVVVTDRRVMFPDNEYAFTSLSGARMTHQGRNHYMLLTSIVTLGIVGMVALTPEGGGRWAWFASMSLIGLIVRYAMFTPRYFVRLCSEGGIEFDAAESTSAAWAADVVRAIEDGISRVSPAYAGPQRATAKVSGTMQSMEAVGACGGVVFAAVCVGALFPSNAASSTTESPRSPTAAATSDEAPPTPASEQYTVRPGDSWGGIAARIGITPYALASMNDATVDTTIHPGAVLLVPAGSRLTSAANSTSTARQPTHGSPQPTRRVEARQPHLSTDDEMTISMACTRYQMRGDVTGYQQCKTAMLLTAASTDPAPALDGLPADLATTIQMGCSRYQLSGDLSGHRNCIRLKVAAIAPSSGTVEVTPAATEAQRLTEGTEGMEGKDDQPIRTWHCADRTLQYSTSATACSNHGGVDPTRMPYTLAPRPR